MHVHFASTLPYDTHDTWVWNGALDIQGLVVQLLKLFGVLLLGVHLNFKGIDFKELCAFLQVFTTIRVLASPVLYVQA